MMAPASGAGAVVIQSEEMFRLAVDTYPGGVVMMDRGGKIAIVNAETEQMFGYRCDELIGQSVDMLVPARLRPQHGRRRERFRPKSRTKGRRMGLRRELFGVRKDGTEFPLEMGLNPIHTQEGLMVLGVIVDISERKEMERLKDELVSTVSHELRTPLTSIAASLGLLSGAAHMDLPATAKRLIMIAQSNSERLVRLINDILDIEKIESGHVLLDLKRVEVTTLVEQTIEANRPLADSFGVRLRLEQSGAHEVCADPDRLVQVVTNLLSNAIKFSPRAAEVVVSVDAHNDMVRISVRDHGAGLPESFRPHVFERFAQADAVRQKGGTGLGLSIVKQIVLQLGGEVDFVDAPGGGTIFYVELPGLKFTAHGDARRRDRSNRTRISLCKDDIEVAAVIRDRMRLAGGPALRVVGKTERA